MNLGGIIKQEQILRYHLVRTKNTVKTPLYFEDANEIEIYDQHLFWKGSGAIAKPELSQKHELLSVVVTSGGFGYSNKVEARVTGSFGQKSSNWAL